MTIHNSIKKPNAPSHYRPLKLLSLLVPFEDISSIAQKDLLLLKDIWLIIDELLFSFLFS